MSRQVQGPPVAEGSAAVTISNELEVTENVLVSPQTSISIHNIATIAVVPIIKKAWNTYPAMVVVAILAFAIHSNLQPQYNGEVSGQATLLVATAVIMIVLFVIRHSTPAPEYRLQIGASDGSINYFTSPRREILDEVRELLTKRLNTRDGHTLYNINFENGNVQIVERGAAVGTAVQGDGNRVASGNGRIDTIENTNSPGAQIGNGNYSSNNTFPAVDYSAIIPQIVNLRAQYADQKDYAYIIERLDRLEALLKSGVATENGKRELRSLLTDFAQIFNTLPTIASFFRSIGTMAGIGI